MFLCLLHISMTFFVPEWWMSPRKPSRIESLWLPAVFICSRRPYILSLLPQGTKAISSYCELNSQYAGPLQALAWLWSRICDFLPPGSNSLDALAEIGSGSTVLCSVRTVPICLDFSDPDGSHSRCVRKAARYTCAPGFVMK